MNSTKKKINVTSGVLGFLVTFSFGLWLLVQQSSQSLNVASWTMWTLLDAITLALMIKGGDREPYLMVGWTVSAVLITAGMLIKGAVWQFGVTEVISMVAVSFAVILWVKNLWGKGIIICAVAMFVAGVPQLVTFWSAPARDTWWLWVGTGTACLISILSSVKVKSIYNAPLASSLLFQLVALAVLYRTVLYR